MTAKFLTGSTNAEGVLRVPIPPNARRGKLIVGADRAEYNLKFGQIEPPDELRGVQSRLNNLGYECPINGNLDEETITALREFQFACEMKITGEIDETTRQKLDELHDNVCDIPNRDEAKENDAQEESESEFETPVEEVEDQSDLKDESESETEVESDIDIDRQLEELKEDLPGNKVEKNQSAEEQSEEKEKRGK